MRRSLSRSWTEEEIATLRRLWASNARTYTIAIRVRRSPQAIETMGRKLGLPARDWRGYSEVNYTRQLSGVKWRHLSIEEEN